MATSTKLKPRPIWGGIGQQWGVGPSPTAPKTIAVTGPTVQPFLTPADLLTINNFNTNDATARDDLTRSLADLTTNTNYQIGQVGQDAIKASSAASDNAAARGLSRSSIRDGALYDIEAQKRIQTGLLNDRLTTAQTDATARLGTLDTAKQGFDTAMAGQQVANAQAIEPTVTTTPTLTGGYKPPAAGSTPAGPGEAPVPPATGGTGPPVAAAATTHPIWGGLGQQWAAGSVAPHVLAQHAQRITAGPAKPKAPRLGKVHR